MDSHRRHELEHNSLYQALQRVPGLLVDYGSYVLLGLAVVVALYFFFRTRSTAVQQEREAEAVGLYSMAETVDAAQQFRRLSGFMSSEEVAARHSDLASNFEAYSLLPATSQRPGVRSRALRLRGDFGWTLATYPKPRPAGVGPSTQPATAPATAPTTQRATAPAPTTQPSQAEVWLGEAEAAYREVVEKYPGETADNLAALFGLAAIAEERGLFEDAARHYEALIARADASEGVKNLARQRKRLLGILAMNPRLAKSLPPATLPAAQPTTLPTTLPTEQPSAQPTTAPTTQPALPN